MVEKVKRISIFHLKFVSPHTLYMPVFEAHLCVPNSLKHFLTNFIIIKERKKANLSNEFL